MNNSLLIRCLLFIVCFIPVIVSGQVQLYSGGNGSTFNPFGTRVENYIRVYKSPLVSGIVGSSYLNDEWLNADIILDNDNLLI